MVHKQGSDFGKQCQGKKIMIEYPSPNTNKPLHLGHIRNMLIGSCTSKMYRFMGNNVIEANLNNDRGVHICKSMLAYKLWGKNKEPDEKSDHYVGKWYIKFAREAKKDKNLEKKALEMLSKWEAGDKKVVALWKKMNAWAYGGFEETYAKFGINFDKYYYESDFYTKGKEIVDKGLKKGVFEKTEDGAIMAPLEKTHKIPDKILLRADGTSIYITQDIYLAKLKFDDHPKMNMNVYVTAHEQDMHFKQLFAVLELLKFPWAKKCRHLSYGMVNLPHGRMKSREGTVVDADNLIENMEHLAKKEIKKRHDDLSKEEVDHRAHEIGLGALKFFILKVDPNRDVTFNPKESISFEGETGPYVQYTHARICSLFAKAGQDAITKVKFEYLSNAHEKRLVTLLSRFPLVVEDAAQDMRPSTLAHYLIEVSQAFNEFYHACPVIGADAELRKARLLLCGGTRTVLKSGLALLGIEAPERM